MRRVTLYLDLPRDVRSDSIVEEVLYGLFQNADPETRRYLQLTRIESGTTKTVDLDEGWRK